MKIIILSILVCMTCGAEAQDSWDCEVFPSEREITTDPGSGAEVVFVTTAETLDRNLYFHQNSWLPDGSLLFFFSERGGQSELFGYVEATGELVRIQTADKPAGGLPTASRHGNRFFLSRGNSLFEWTVDVQPASSGSEKPTRVRVTERKVGDLPDPQGAGLVGLSENSDGSGLFVGFGKGNGTGGRIYRMNVQTGGVETVAAWESDNISHIQGSWENPDLVMFCKTGALGDRYIPDQPGAMPYRLWFADMTDREPWPLYRKLPGELVTHECWWTDDQVVFCAGERITGKAEDAHVKVIDTKTGIARIIGAGSWWPDATPEQLSKRNWWHCAGGPGGKFVVADNWHGDIGVMSALSARTRLLVQDHRTYGKGEHPHVGWNPDGTKVVFASNKRGNVDVVVATLPQSWITEPW